MSNDKIIKALYSAAKRRGVTVREVSRGHFHIRGKLLVNYYPLSKKQSAYVSGTSSKETHVEPEQAVAMSLKQPPISSNRKKRRKSYTKIRNKMFRTIKHCYWCGRKMTTVPDQPNSATVEHKIPLARGGLDNANNRTLACRDCNQSRGCNMPELRSGT